MRRLAALRSPHARNEVEIAGIASPFSVDRVPVMSGGSEEEADTAGRMRLRAVFVPPLEAILQARLAISRPGHSLSGPNSCLQRNPDAGRAWPRVLEKGFLAGVGQSSLLLLKDPFSCGDLRAAWARREAQIVFTASARILLPSVPFLGMAGVGDC